MHRSRKRFVHRLKALRARCELSQAALAKKVGVSREYIARLELGQHNPPLSTLGRLAKALKVKVTELLE